ncbi:MAG: hypothetical protein K2P70_08300 [Hyphomonadaceae bacterium]|jgi:hypothetical protein|nr:hypothetical protein [Hyphomonadaceae bacterium]
MRALVLAAIAAFGLALGGCQREGETEQAPNVRRSTIVEPEIRNVDVVPQEEPAVARQQWRASSESARTVSGNLRVSLVGPRGGPVVFAFANGITIQAQPYAVVPANSRSGVGGQSYAAVIGGDPRVNAWLFRVQAENVSASAVQGGLCTTDRTRFLAVSEFVDAGGRWVFKIAAFSGEGEPGERPTLCNAYAFTAQ